MSFWGGDGYIGSGMPDPLCSFGYADTVLKLQADRCVPEMMRVQFVTLILLNICFVTVYKGTYLIGKYVKSKRKRSPKC